MGLGGVVVLGECEKAKQGGGDVSEHDYTNNLPSINKMNVCGYVME